MKKIFLSLFLLINFFALQAKKSELDSLFSLLDNEIAKKEAYVQQKERQITDYKEMFKIPGLTREQEYNINQKIYHAYVTFMLDSAIVYMQKNIEIAKEFDNKDWLTESKIRLSSSYSLAGFFIDALHLLQSIDRKCLQGRLLQDYYSAYSRLYFYHPANDYYEKQHRLYQDSASMLQKIATQDPRVSLSNKLMFEEKYKEARSLLTDLYGEAEDGSHWKAMVANNIGKTYRGENNIEMQKKYFAIAAIYDIRNAIKEHESFRALATVCYNSNDIESAYILKRN